MRLCIAFQVSVGMTWPGKATCSPSVFTETACGPHVTLKYGIKRGHQSPIYRKNPNMKTVTLASDTLGSQFTPYLQALLLPNAAITDDGVTDLLVRLDPLLVNPNKKTAGVMRGSQVFSLS